MYTTFETSFLVMPEHANSMSPMIFGGAFFSEMDLCAANTVRRVLYDSDACSDAVTHKFEGTYHHPCYLGDLILLRGEVLEIRKKSLLIEVKAWREVKKEKVEQELVADAKFVFVSIQQVDNIHEKPHSLPYAFHGISMPE
jgi:acyl-CoA hydrolase